MKRYSLFFSLLIALGYAAQAQHATFNNTFTENIGSSFDFVGIGDLNGDGLNDIAGATTFFYSPSSDYRIFSWLQGSNGHLQAPISVPYSQPGEVTCLTVRDLFNDGTAEVLIGLKSQIKIYSCINNELTLQDSLLTHPGVAHTGIITDDLDGDGLIDIAVSHFGGDRITVAYQKGQGGAKWDMRHYTTPTAGPGHVITGKFSSLQKTSLVYLSQINPVAISVFTFNSTRDIANQYGLRVPFTTPNSIAIVKKNKAGTHNELWATYGGNTPSSKVAIWRGLQELPDSSFSVFDIPQSIQSANLDCDEDDEPVVLHSGFSRATVFASGQDKYPIPYGGHYEHDGLSLGDVNNDGLTDICIAGTLGSPNKSELVVLYNTTPPCWPANVAATNTPAKELTIYPNPAQQNTTITYNGKGQLLITDAQGRSVHNTAFHQKATVDMAPWAAGIYFAILRTDDGQVLTKKLVKE